MTKGVGTDRHRRRYGYRAAGGGVRYYHPRAVLRSSVVARHAGLHLREVPVVVVAWKAPLPRTLTEALVPISIRRELIAGTPMHSLINWLVLGGFIIGSLGMLAGSSALLVLTFCRRNVDATAAMTHMPVHG